MTGNWFDLCAPSLSGRGPERTKLDPGNSDICSFHPRRSTISHAGSHVFAYSSASLTVLLRANRGLHNRLRTLKDLVAVSVDRTPTWCLLIRQAVNRPRESDESIILQYMVGYFKVRTADGEVQGIHPLVSSGGECRNLRSSSTEESTCE